MNKVTAAVGENTPVPAARFVPTGPSAPAGLANWQLAAYPCADACRSFDHDNGGASYSERYVLWVSR